MVVRIISIAMMLGLLLSLSFFFAHPVLAASYDDDYCGNGGGTGGGTPSPPVEEYQIN